MQKYIETLRLILRDWKEEDIPFFARMNADPNVMEFFLNSLSSEESFAFYQRIQNEFQTCGFGLYAVERKEDHAFMGYTGLHQITFDGEYRLIIRNIYIIEIPHHTMEFSSHRRHE